MHVHVAHTRAHTHTNKRSAITIIGGEEADECLVSSPSTAAWSLPIVSKDYKGRNLMYKMSLQEGSHDRSGDTLPDEDNWSLTKDTF